MDCVCVCVFYLGWVVGQSAEVIFKSYKVVGWGKGKKHMPRVLAGKNLVCLEN